MDPVSRKLMVSLISRVAKDRVVLFTTHHIGEAEDICHRVGIMNHGRLVGLGTAQHLRDKFGASYTLEIGLLDVSRVEEVADAVRHIFAECVLLEVEGRVMVLEVGAKREEFADMFAQLVSLKEKYPVVGEFAVTQTSLESVFLKLTQQQQEVK